MTPKAAHPSKPKLLVVEDERDVKELMLLHLKREGYEVVSAENGEEGLKLLSLSKDSKDPVNLVILDWMLPGQSGLEICKKLNRTLPVLMVTARADSADIVLGLEMGADDYITKPFEIPVFLARVRALLRRTAEREPDGAPELRIESLTLNEETHEVRCGSELIHLTPSEFKLLAALMKSGGRVLSRDKLIELVQGEGIAVVDRAIDTHVFGLRKKLGSCADIIETIRGVGYRVKPG